MRGSAFLVAGGVALLGGFAYFSMRNPKNQPVVEKPDPIRLERQMSDRLYASQPAKAEEGYREFIERHEDSPSPKVQDEVAAARLRVGYLAARQSDFAKARTVFLQAAEKYKGEGAMGADFGGLKDQAAYQAGVCLMAEKKSEEALEAFQAFIRDYPLSPLVHAAHRRLEMLAPESQEEHDALLQKAVAAQEKHIRFETSVCGPKVIAYILEKQGKEKPDYKEIAKLCGTTGDGTTLEGMRKGIRALGLESFGYELNREDFLKLKAPAILLRGDHYVALVSLTADYAVVYDPVRGGEDKFPLPKADQTDFSIPVLTFEPMRL